MQEEMGTMLALALANADSMNIAIEKLRSVAHQYSVSLQTEKP